MNHPIAVRPETRNKQKTIADFLALGMQPSDIAIRIGVSIDYIRALLKGELFQFEVAEARKRLIGERLEEYSKMLSEQLPNNLRTLVAIRDADDAKDSDKLRAIEIIQNSVVPHAKPKGEATASLHVHLTPEQVQRATGAIKEVDVTPGTDSTEE